MLYICTNNKIDEPFQYDQHDAILYVYEYTEMIAGWSNGDVAVNSYHLYEVSTKMPLTSYIPKCGAILIKMRCSPSLGRYKTQLL